MTIRLSIRKLRGLAPWDAQYIINLAQREVDEVEGFLWRGRTHVTPYRQKLQPWARTRGARIEKVRHGLWGDDEHVARNNGEPRP